MRSQLSSSPEFQLIYSIPALLSVAGYITVGALCLPARYSLPKLLLIRFLALSADMLGADDSGD